MQMRPPVLPDNEVYSAVRILTDLHIAKKNFNAQNIWQAQLECFSLLWKKKKKGVHYTEVSVREEKEECHKNDCFYVLKSGIVRKKDRPHNC